MFYQILYLLLVIFSYGYAKPIFGGKDAGKVVQTNPLIITGQEKFGFMTYLYIVKKVLIEGKSKQEVTDNCAGTIISQEAVITAGHCFLRSLSKPLVYVKYGFVHREYEYYSSPGTWADDHIVHEDFQELYQSDDKMHFYTNDIAIVFLETPLFFTDMNPKVTKVDLAEFDDVPIETTGLILGWGIDETGHQSKMLKQAYTQVISNARCQWHAELTKITSNVLCILSRDKTVSTCPGDSGGPFLIGGILYGIMSFGLVEKAEEFGRCTPKRPQILTSVGRYKHWIKGNLALRRQQRCKRRYDESVNRTPSQKKLKPTLDEIINFPTSNFQ